MPFTDDKPIPANEAVDILNSVDDAEVKALLGFPPVIKAEAYTGGTTAKYKDDVMTAGTAAQHTNLLIAAVFISAFLVILVLVALLFLLHRAKTNGGFLRHRKLQGSPISGISSSQHPSQRGLHSSLGGSVSIQYCKIS